MPTTIDRDDIEHFWEDQILPTFMDFLRIPNVSPAFDPEWEKNGHMEKAVRLVVQWVEAQKIPGAKVTIERLPHRTPLLIVDVPGPVDKTVLIYGHLDKQPEASGWLPGLGPWSPVIREDKLFARGTVDDGYAVFTAIAAIKAIHAQKLPSPRVVLLIECSEETGSEDLEAYCDHCKTLIGTPNLVVCLDAGGANYDQLWISTSQRGVVTGTLKVQVLESGAHSGGASGIVPSSFRILRQLLNRVEDATTGEVTLPAVEASIPPQRLAEAKALAAFLGNTVHSAYTFVDEMQPVSPDPLELILNRSWRPTLSYIGIDGLPSCQTGGNILRPFTQLKLSFRLPPTVPAKHAAAHIRETLTQDPPYGARITFEIDSADDGWVAPDAAPEFTQIVTGACQAEYGRPPMFMGLGGSIPFLASFGKKFSAAQFLVTGALGPGSNAHGPNEFLNIPFTKKLTACLARILSAF